MISQKIQVASLFVGQRSSSAHAFSHLLSPFESLDKYMLARERLGSQARRGKVTLHFVFIHAFFKE